MGVLAGFAVFFLAVVAWAVHTSRRLGPSTANAEEIVRGTVLLSATQGDGVTWHRLGAATQAQGLWLLFNADDDPAAEATMLLPGVPDDTRAMANLRRVQLSAEYATEVVTSSGHAFVVRLRGTGKVVGRYVKIQMRVDLAGQPLGVQIENDDSTRYPPAVGDWIEISSIAVVRLP